MNTLPSPFFCSITTTPENLVVIFNDILDFLKLEADKPFSGKIKFKPKLVIEKTLHILEHMLKEKALAMDLKKKKQ